MEWKCAFRPTLPIPVPQGDHALYKQKMEKFFCAFESLPLSPRFPLDQPEEMEDYDTVVVGSDEVWNLFHPWYARCALFFGDDVKAKRLISYAASFGTYHAWNGLNQEWADRLRNFDSISVRDENSWWVIKSALEFEPDVVLDPCLQFPPQPEGPWRGPQQPFIAVYGHNFSENFMRQARRYADARRLPLVSVGYRNDWADGQWIEAGPHDFAHFMARAEAVVTNFFHGCVFSMLNAKPFVCEPTSYRSNKIMDLIAGLGAQKHMVSYESPAEIYDACLSKLIAPEILQKIESLRSASNSYLDKALS
jgi:hypothetical protein